MAGLRLQWALLFFLNFGLISSVKEPKPDPYLLAASHQCFRTCEYPPKPRLCEYEFVVEWFNSMPAYCWNCPIDIKNCERDQCIHLDGSSRPIVLTNGMLPGPSLQVCQGDTIRVTFNNTLVDQSGVSIHWHGIHQVGTNWMDGVSMITQCPLTRGPLFVYEFLADPAGTHWWHDISGVATSDGLHGTLIVRKPSETVMFSDEYDYDLAGHVISVGDWSSMDGLETYTSAYVPAKVTRSHTISILVNGNAEGVEYVDLDDGLGYYTPRKRFDVQDGFRYRMRMVSSSSAVCNVAVYVQSHPLLIIALDGSEVHPIEVDYFIMAPGESYDFVLNANAEPSSYCMYFVGTSTSSCTNHSSAILTYNNLTNNGIVCNDTFMFDQELSTPSHLRTISLDELKAVDVADPDLFTVDDTHYISLRTYMIDDEILAGYSYGIPSIDNVALTLPSSPFISPKQVDLELCEPNVHRHFFQACEQTLCYCTNVLKLKLGQVIEFILTNTMGDLIRYSMHLHGQSFRLLGQGTFDNQSLSIQDVIELDTAGKLERLSPANAIIKNTVDVPVNGYAILRWKADNPGYWYFSSNVVSHNMAGMGMVVQVGDDAEIPNPPDDFPTCEPWAPK